MARQWIDPSGGVQIDEDGAEEYIVPMAGVQLQEDQPEAQGNPWYAYAQQ